MARAWADIDLSAVAHNVEVLRNHVAPSRLCAVVKADGYGHGAVAVGRVALEAGAEWLAVAQVPEAVALREAGIDAPVLLLSEPRHDEIDIAAALGIRITAYTQDMVAALAESAGRRHAADGPLRLHLKVDTGMRRVGAASDDMVPLAKAIADHDRLALEGVFTHLPVADEPGNPFTGHQLARFDALLDELRSEGVHPEICHAANSAGALSFPEARYDLVRCGIATYGIPPAPVLDGAVDLRPALTLASEVSFVKHVPPGQGISYGLRQHTKHETVVATVPIGYADGVFRSLPLAGNDVLINGQRRRMIGVVTMDQVMIDCGADPDVRPGDPVVLLGAQGDERITPDEWADKLGTISYEVVCAIGPRVERRHHP
jgi:alanine racemase